MKARQTAEGVFWYEVRQGTNVGFAINWQPVPGWYNHQEAKWLAAALRRSGYKARIISCEVVS
jgi:hypothetical protein